MKYLIIFFAFLSANILSQSCEIEEIDLNPGDAISSDLFKEIFSRLSYTTGLTPDELDGTWSCTSSNSTTSTNNGYVLNSDGVGVSMTQNVTFNKQSNDTFIVTYLNNLGQSAAQTGTNTCKGKILGKEFFMSLAETGDCFNQGVAQMKKIAKQCFAWDVKNGQTSGTTYCSKTNGSPYIPTDLTVTMNSGNVNLSWTAGTGATTYTVKVRSSIMSPYSELISGLTENTYTDTLASGDTKWYRVYGVNDNGISTGSNVVSVSR